MKCPYCAYDDSRVIDSRPAEEGNSIRRRRECLSCGKRFTTYEVIERLPLVVVKNDGSRQGFDRVKIINGLVRACEKRPVTLQQLEKIADDIQASCTVRSNVRSPRPRSAKWSWPDSKIWTRSRMCALPPCTASLRISTPLWMN